MNISRISSKEDCHYFYYTTNGCNKVACAFRHEVASKGQEKRCLEWLQTKRCSIPSCPLRHKALDKDRAKELCFFETAASCVKPDCPFFHTRPRPTVPTKTTDAVLYCPICKVTSSSQAGHVAHLQGKNHFQKINELRGIPPPNMIVPPTVVPGAKVRPPPQRAHSQPQMSAFYCKSCQVNLYTKDKFDAHFQNPPHKKIGGAQALKKTPTQTFHCKVCDQTLRNKFFYDQHMNSPEHRVAVEGSKSLSGSNSSSSMSKLHQQVVLQPPPPFGEIKVGVFWDLENCQLSSKIDIPGVVQKLKQGHGHKGVFDQFVGACNMDNHKRIALTMQELGMDILPVLNNEKNAADDLLKNKMMSFAENPHCRIILISGDVDFSQQLLHCREKKGHEVLLFHNHVAKESLKSVVTKAFSYHGFVKPFLKDLPDRTRSKSVARGAPPRPKKTSKAVLFFWDMMSLPAPANVKVGAVVSKLRNTFLCATETTEAGFAACRSISQMAAVNHVAQMSVDLSLNSALDMLKEQVGAKKDIDILILLTNDIGLSETIRKLKTERKIQIHLIRDEKCQEPLAYSLDEQSQESFQEFVKPLVPAV